MLFWLSSEYKSHNFSDSKIKQICHFLWDMPKLLIIYLIALISDIFLSTLSEKNVISTMFFNSLDVPTVSSLRAVTDKEIYVEFIYATDCIRIPSLVDFKITDSFNNDELRWVRTIKLTLPIDYSNEISIKSYNKDDLRSLSAHLGIDGKYLMFGDKYLKDYEGSVVPMIKREMFKSLRSAMITELNNIKLVVVLILSQFLTINLLR